MIPFRQALSAVDLARRGDHDWCFGDDDRGEPLDLQPIECESLAGCGAPVRHGFFTRRGGSSGGSYAGLNTGLGSADERDAVNANRTRIAEHLRVPRERLATPHQYHSADVIVVEEPWGDNRPKADALVTNRPDLAIGVVTADCGPVLFCDAAAGVIGAAHSGWPGAFSGVLENTVKAMESLGATRQHTIATVGPTISQDNYEVGPEFIDRFIALDAGNERFFRSSSKPDHAMFDLPGYIVTRLNNADVEARWTGQCTYAHEDDFYSYRRATHRGEPDYGRQLSAIVLHT